MATSTTRAAIVIGGGIGGFSAAIALRQRGIGGRQQVGGLRVVVRRVLQAPIPGLSTDLPTLIGGNCAGSLDT